MATTNPTIPEIRSKIFTSVFPPLSPAAPESIAPAIPSHNYNTRHHSVDPPIQLLPNSQAREAKAWLLATGYLRFPTNNASTGDPFGGSSGGNSGANYGYAELPGSVREWIEWKGMPGRDVQEALRYLVVEGGGREKLLEWFMDETRRHLMSVVKGISVPTELTEDGDYSCLLEDILVKLRTAQSIYLYILKTFILLPRVDTSSPRKNSRRRAKDHEQDLDDNNPHIKTFLRSLNAVISHSLPDPHWSNLVYTVFLDLCAWAVGLHQPSEDAMSEDDDATVKDDTDAMVMDDDRIYDKLSFITETDLDGDSILVTTDEGDRIIPEEFDGIDDFARYKNTPRGPKHDARRKVLRLWRDMEKLGIGGAGRRGERVFAEVINTLITNYINDRFARQWQSPSTASAELDQWIETVLGSLIVDVLFSSTVRDAEGDARLDKLSPRESLRVSRESLVKRRLTGMDIDFGFGAGEEEEKRRREDLSSWKKIALGRLGRLRVKELFEIIVDWPDSLGGVEDLKAYITTPERRLHVTKSFSNTLEDRIMHPGASTIDVVAAYIRLIRAFTLLDPRGVLLDRVSRAVRRYLRERDDTVKVIVRGIMSDILTNHKPTDIDELAHELSKGIPTTASGSNGLDEMDFDDMTWVPDPVDAGPEFRRSKGLDVVGSLFSLYESKEVWLKEIRTILSQRFLDTAHYEFEQESRIIELLKLRFGDHAIQPCDVMTKDMADSKRLDTAIKDSLKHQNFQQQQQLPFDPIEFRAKILSRYYWINLKQEPFLIPSPIKTLMSTYSSSFEKLKSKRCLEWLLPIGHVEIELELQDRTIHIPHASPAQAAVIYAFNDTGIDLPSDGPKAMAFEQLQQELQMADDTLISSITFWIEKQVLVESSPRVYTVLETLDGSMETMEQEGEQETAEEEERKQEEEKKQEKAVIEQFVKGMLMNGGSMPSDRISMMLGMLVPGGFRWSLEELNEFLLEMKERRVIESTGSGWKVV
ncbi:hypothetical protein BZA77DRAFT_341244 [Pyronema omphalodes]|nr:hypothetical protein BZA77DRAFT_341244 [Pyronema omphalodes]